MTETILVALLSLIGTLAGAYLANRRSVALIAYRLQALEERVAKHNSLIERTYALEKTAEVVKEQIRVANHRIGDLERKEQ